jgi:hypothetical protein
MRPALLLALLLALPACGGGGGGGDDDGGGAGGGDDDSSAASGLEAFCAHYLECGGTYYASAQACVDASLAYWTACRRPELDAFGECMKDLDCATWNPDAYNPASTPCASEYQDLAAATCN